MSWDELEEGRCLGDFWGSSVFQGVAISVETWAFIQMMKFSDNVAQAAEWGLQTLYHPSVSVLKAVQAPCSHCSYWKTAHLSESTSCWR